jgi:ABC-type glycerol-3-phosphate transport system substrate-binding protein
MICWHSVWSLFAEGQPEVGEEVNLELYYYKQEIADEMPGFVELFEEANPGITVDLLIVPNDENKTLNTRAAAGDLPDIVQLQSYAAVKEFAGKGLSLDLSR